jgi:hypothetical protein
MFLRVDNLVVVAGRMREGATGFTGQENPKAHNGLPAGLDERGRFAVKSRFCQTVALPASPGRRFFIITFTGTDRS